jgi:hypothetical protein
MFTLSWEASLRQRAPVQSCGVSDNHGHGTDGKG